MPTSWQVRLAALLACLGVVPGGAMLVLAANVLQAESDYLFFLLPILAAIPAVAGLFVASASLLMSVRLWIGARGARFQTAAFGAVLLVAGLCSWPIEPWVGLLIVLQGLALLGLMCTAAARSDLHGWIDGFDARVR